MKRRARKSGVLGTGDKFYEHQGGNGPRSQPTVDGERVFVLSAEGWLYALNAKDGKKLWAGRSLRWIGQSRAKIRVFDVAVGRGRFVAFRGGHTARDVYRFG